MGRRDDSRRSEEGRRLDQTEQERRKEKKHNRGIQERGRRRMSE